MSSRRLLKAAQAIREVVGMCILTDLKDPRIQDVTVTFVEISPDMRMAPFKGCLASLRGGRPPRGPGCSPVRRTPVPCLARTMHAGCT